MVEVYAKVCVCPAAIAPIAYVIVVGLSPPTLVVGGATSAKNVKPSANVEVSVAPVNAKSSEVHTVSVVVIVSPGNAAAGDIVSRTAQAEALVTAVRLIGAVVPAPLTRVNDNIVAGLPAPCIEIVLFTATVVFGVAAATVPTTTNPRTVIVRSTPATPTSAGYEIVTTPPGVPGNALTEALAPPVTC